MSDGLDVTWLGHASVVLDIGATRILTDPLLRRHAPPLRRRGAKSPAVPAWSGPSAVLLSHLHHDHADLPSLRRLAGVPVYTAPTNAEWLLKQGLSSVAMNEGEWLPIGNGTGVAVASVPAVHHSRRMPHRPNAANGYLVKAGAGAVWFAGDTSLYDDMTGLPAIVGGRIDLAIVPIGGWGARLSKGHMGPREAAQACAMVGAGAVLPVHWGTLYAPWLPDIPRGWMDRPGPAFAAALRDEAPECRLVALEPGGSAHLTLDSPGVGESDPE